MARLYDRVPDSDSGDGYYIKLKYKGDVKTYQTHNVAEELYDELGYEAEVGGGDSIPNRLVWALENAGLHYKRGESTDPDKETIEEVIDGELDSLTSEERKKIREFIQKRGGGSLFDVAEELEIEVDEASGGGENEGTITSFMRLNYDFTDEVESAVEEWNISGSADETLTIIDRNERVRESVRQIRRHPWEVDQVDISEEVVRYEIRETIKTGNLFNISPNMVVDYYVSDDSKIDYDIQQHYPRPLESSRRPESSLQIEEGLIVENAMEEHDMSRTTVGGADNISTVFLSFACMEFVDGLENYILERDIPLGRASLYNAYQRLKKEGVY